MGEVNVDIDIDVNVATWKEQEHSAFHVLLDLGRPPTLEEVRTADRVAAETLAEQARIADAIPADDRADWVEPDEPYETLLVVGGPAPGGIAFACLIREASWVRPLFAALALNLAATGFDGTLALWNGLDYHPIWELGRMPGEPDWSFKRYVPGVVGAAAMVPLDPPDRDDPRWTPRLRGYLTPEALAVAARAAWDWCADEEGDLYFRMDRTYVRAAPETAPTLWEVAHRRWPADTTLTRLLPGGRVRRAELQMNGWLLLSTGATTTPAWEPLVEDVLTALAEIVSHVEYALLKPTSNLTHHFDPFGPVPGTGKQETWPRRLDDDTLLGAWPIQLLRPTQRVPPGLTHWTTRPYAEGRTLLETTDLDAVLGAYDLDAPGYADAIAELAPHLTPDP